jgi:hypothetical protein
VKIALSRRLALFAFEARGKSAPVVFLAFLFFLGEACAG